MRVLLVSHNYPPAHTAGVEQHAAQVARELKRRGHDVAVFTAEKDVSRTDGKLVEREHDGVRVFELTNNLAYRAFRETWEFEPAERAFAGVLEAFAPDVVHFQHLMNLSSRCLELVGPRGAACVFTLHDYWVQCPRFGQRLHPDGSICATIDFARCGACMAGFKFAQSGLERSAGRWIAGLKDSLGVDVSKVAKDAARKLGLARSGEAAIDPNVAESLAAELRTRDFDLRERVLRCADRLIAPSRFLLERMVEWGVPRERLELLRMGAEVDRFASHPRQRAAGSGEPPLRVVFLGTFAPHKAPLLVVEAWERLPAELRAGARLELYGSSAHYPDYVDELRRRADEVGAHVGGVLSRDGVARTLTSCDLLVMPSVWWENAPLVLIEAVEARTPILVSDLGGMAEFVSERPCGAVFAPGDAADLAAKLGALLAHPERLAEYYRALKSNNMRSTVLIAFVLLSACASDSKRDSDARATKSRAAADSSARIAHVSELPADHRELLRAYGQGGEAWERARERALADPALTSFVVENLFLELARAHRVIGGRESERARAARDRAHAELARMGEAAAPTLVAALEVADDVSAQLAMDVLGDIGRPALPPLIEGLSHAQPQARRRAADALARVQHGALEEPRVRDALIGARDDREWFVRAQVARALGARGSRDMETAPWRNALIAMLSDPDIAVVEAAANGLAQLADPRAVGALVERLSKAAQVGEPRVFRAAQNALVQLTGLPPQPSIDAWAAWWRANRARIERAGAR